MPATSLSEKPALAASSLTPWLCSSGPPIVLCPTHHLLLQYAADPEPIVADSCIVALDMLEFEQSGGFHYADDGQPEVAAAATEAAAEAVGASA
jgi:hypothetical protein